MWIWGQSPPKPMSGCENNAYTIRLSERFTVTTNVQNTLQHFQRGGGQVPPLAHACGCPCSRIYSSINIQISALCGQIQIGIGYSGLCDTIAYQTADGRVVLF